MTAEHLRNSIHIHWGKPSALGQITLTAELRVKYERRYDEYELDRADDRYRKLYEEKTKDELMRAIYDDQRQALNEATRAVLGHCHTAALGAHDAISELLRVAKYQPPE